MTFPIVTANGPSGYNLTRSLRFRSSASAYLSKAAYGTGGGITTWAAWVKRGTLGVTNQILFTSTDRSDYYDWFGFNSSDQLSYWHRYNNSDATFSTSAVFRDPSAWYFIQVVIDSTQASNSNRVKIYVNSTQQTLTTSGTFTQNQGIRVFSSSSATNIGGTSAYITSNYFDGYVAEMNLIDGQALTPSSFGSTNALTGVWQPARYVGTYGTNGFYLPFTDNSALTTSSNVGIGKDFSGNGNYWVTNNISITSGVTYDSMTDVPTLTSATASNFAVANPLQKGSYATVSNGNLTVTGNTASDSGLSLATIGKLTSGKWYWEYTQGTVQSETCGVMTQNVDGFALNNGEATTASYGVGARANGDVYGAEKTTATITSWTNGDVIGIAVDCDNGAIYWSKNGTWLNSGVPTSGASKTGAVGVWTPSSTKIITPSFGAYNGGFINATFGQRPFSYTLPTGFVALNTYNLPTPTILKGNTAMDATLYTGTLATQSVTNAASFKPDLVWVKSRSAATDNKLTDSVRGATKGLVSNSTAAETTDTLGLTAFNSNGFTVGTDTNYNNLAATYVGWQWQAGQGTTSSNTSGSITSTVSVNASAGFSVVTYSGNGSAGATVGHGLGVAPSMMIVKCRTAATNSWSSWQVYHASLSSPATSFLRLNETTATYTGYAAAWNSTNPTSSVFSIRYDSGAGVNGSGDTFVAYCFAPIAGYSAFGSYTGNGSADGPFVYVGFRPKFVMYKRTDTGGSNWYILDTARSPYNVSQTELVPNSSIAEFTSSNANIDVNSNGFKIRTTDTDRNASGGTYIYACFAETPFRTSLAR